MTFEVLSATPEFVEFSAVRDESFTVPTREKYTLTFTVPPGSPVGNWDEDGIGKLHIATNRDSAKEFELYVSMVIRE